ncbi:MAG: class I SAM-dependent methyltransferase [Actinobacteria bacterium]|nr:class I SAM-dependent methyltransferase [Actinomycetota bacterium]
MSQPPAAWGASTEDWNGVLRYGPVVADETTLRLCGPLAGKKVLVLGCGAGQAPVELARAGARVVGVEPSPTRVEAARSRCTAAEVAVELHRLDLAELAFVRADTIDLAFSAMQLCGVADPTRVFRQLHRVLRPDAALVCSLPHPALALTTDGPKARYAPTTPRPWTSGSERGEDHGHTLGALVTAFVRTGFRLDTLHELPTDTAVPTVVVLRARKIGALTVNG